MSEISGYEVNRVGFLLAQRIRPIQARAGHYTLLGRDAALDRSYAVGVRGHCSSPSRLA